MTTEHEDRPAIAEDVARLANVSTAAVSRAFTPGASVAPATRKRILAAAEQVGYRPNMIARSLMRGRSNMVGVGVGNLANPFLSTALDALSIKLSEEGLKLLLFTANTDSVTRASITEVLQYRLDALILMASTLPDELARQCQRERVPVVLFNRCGAVDSQVSSVIGQNYLGGRSLASFLVAGQHRRFAFIAGIAESQPSHEREAGYTEYLLESGYEAPRREIGAFTYAEASAATRRLLLARDRPDAIFCANDLMALAAIDVARSEFGIAVGRDLSIVGFDDISAAGWPSFSLTTFAQSTEAMVDATVDIVQRVRGGSEPIRRVIDGSLVIRTSARLPSTTD